MKHIHRRSYVYVSGAAQRRGAATRAKFPKTKRNSELGASLVIVTTGPPRPSVVSQAIFLFTTSTAALLCDRSSSRLS